MTLVATVGSSFGLAQSSSQLPSAPTLSITSRLVVLDIVVTDAQNKPVPNLKKDNFTLLQDGKPVTIHDFDGWMGRPAPSSTPAVDRYGRPDWGEGIPRTVFVLDELNTPFDQKAYAAENLKLYLDKQLPLLNMPASLISVSYSGLQTLAPYTRERDDLLHALAHRPPVLTAVNDKMDCVAETFAMLRQIALASEGLHTHINLVWIGSGFPSLDPNQFNDPQDAVIKKAIEDTINMLIDARVTVDLVDPTPIGERFQVGDAGVAMSVGAGLNNQLTSKPGEDPLNGVFSFDNFVTATGGSNYFGRNDLDAFIADSQVRSVDFYTLAYRPPADIAEGVFHTITVTMRDPTLHVQTRQGFYSYIGLPVEPTLNDLGFDLKLAAIGAMAFSAIGARITGVSSAGHGQISLNISIDDNGLHWTPRDSGGETAKLTVLLVSLDKNHEIQTSIASTLNLAVKNSRDISAGHVDVSKMLTITSKSQFVRLIARDASGKIGTADVDAATMAKLQADNLRGHRN